MGALAIGITSGVACFFGATTLKRWGGYDDSLDAFGVHGVGGLLGTLLVGVFASDRFGGQVADLDVARQLGARLRDRRDRRARGHHPPARKPR
jgi:Amt family ammonium transporter